MESFVSFLTPIRVWWQLAEVQQVAGIVFGIVDILAVAFIVYWLLNLIRGTLAQQVLIGLFMIALAFLGAKVFHLKTLSWIIDTCTSSLVVLIIVIFQNDIRLALSKVGSNTIFGRKSAGSELPMIDEISRACGSMAHKNIGAIIVLERNGDLTELARSANCERIDAAISAALLEQIFWVGGPLHDGAVIIQKGRISSARVVLPLTKNSHIDPNLGTRHRAAIGVTEEYDCIALVVSEQRGQISLTENGQITRDIEEPILRQVLLKYFEPEKTK